VLNITAPSTQPGIPVPNSPQPTPNILVPQPTPNILVPSPQPFIDVPAPSLDIPVPSPQPYGIVIPDSFQPLIINYDWLLENHTFMSNSSIYVEKNSSFTIGPFSILNLNGNLIVDGNLTINLDSLYIPVLISGCLLSNRPISLYLPTDSPSSVTVLTQNISCPTPQFNIKSYYQGGCSEPLQESIKLVDQMYVTFEYLDNCSSRENNTIWIILGVVLSIIVLVFVLVGIIIKVHNVRLRTEVQKMKERYSTAFGITPPPTNE